MNKQGFLDELKRALGAMSEAEKAEIAADFEEHFRMGMAAGKSEEEIAKALGNPRTLGKSFAIDAMLETGKKEKSAATVLRAVLAFLSLGFFNVVFMLGPFIAFIAIIVSFWAAAVSMAVAGVVAVAAVALQPVLPSFMSFGGLSVPFVLFAAVGVTALGLLGLIGMWFLTRGFIFAVGKYVQFSARIVSMRR
jgi:uncharacterized membrane protein